jgi:FixJ family two-component response regulator
MSIACEFADSVQSFKQARLPWLLPIAPAVFVVAGSLWARRFHESEIRACGWQVHTFASAEEFLAHPRFPGPSCLVLDITLPGLDGLGLQKRLAADRTHMSIVLTRGCGDVLMTVQATTCGSFDLATTAFEGEELPSAVRHAIECSKMALRDEQQIQALQARHDSLSSRERQVMALVAAGLLNKQVGHELGISEITVKAHRGKVMRKMKARSLAELIKMVTNLQLAVGQPRANRAEAGFTAGIS